MIGVPSSFLIQGRIGPQQTNRFCSRLIIGGLFLWTASPGTQLKNLFWTRVLRSCAAIRSRQHSSLFPIFFSMPDHSRHGPLCVIQTALKTAVHKALTQLHFAQTHGKIKVQPYALRDDLLRKSISAVG